MAAIVLSLLGGISFGAMAIFLRKGLARVPDAELGSFHTQAFGLATALIATAIITRFQDIDIEGVWPFLVLGLAVPGMTQMMWTFAVRDIGVSRAMVITGGIPLASSVAAIIFLGEPLRAPLALGTILIVAGGVVLAWDPARPANYKAAGVLWVLATIALFTGRDTISRWVTTDREVSGVVAASALLVGATIAILLYIVVSRRRDRPLRQIAATWRPFVFCGIFFGAAYLSLMEAIDRGEITIVIPLLGTFVLWTVLFAAIFLRDTEAISKRLVIAAVLVVAGAAVVGAFA